MKNIWAAGREEEREEEGKERERKGGREGGRREGAREEGRKGETTRGWMEEKQWKVEGGLGRLGKAERNHNPHCRISHCKSWDCELG